MSVTQTTDLAPEVQAAYDKRFLLTAKPLMVAEQFAQKRTLGQGKGKTVRFTRYLPLPIRKTPLTETADGGITNKTLKTQEIEATVAQYGDVVEISEMASKTAIDVGVKEKVNIVAQQAGETMNALINEVIGKGFLRTRADGDSTYQYEGTVTTEGTKTTLICSGLTQIDDFWNGAYVTFTDPQDKNYGVTVKVTDFVASTDTATVETLPFKTVVGAKFRIVSGYGTLATDVISASVIKKAVRDLKRNKALPMIDGKYIAIVDPDISYDFMNDTEWKSVKQYQDAKDIYQGELGEWCGVRFIEATSIYREDAGTTAATLGDASDTGNGHIVSVLGKEAFGVVELEGGEKKIFVKNGNELGQALELTGTVGWKVAFTAKVLNACFGVNIICGATA